MKNIAELSIGDWVCAEQLCGVHNEPRLTPPMKVVGLGESWVNLEIDPEQGDPFEFEPSEIRGVPITPEILEKNGWRKISESDYIVKWYRYNISINFRPSTGNFTFARHFYGHPKIVLVRLVIGYLHQLQRALLMCGEEIKIVL